MPVLFKRREGAGIRTGRSPSGGDRRRERRQEARSRVNAVSERRGVTARGPSVVWSGGGSHSTEPAGSSAEHLRASIASWSGGARPNRREPHPWTSTRWGSGPATAASEADAPTSVEPHAELPRRAPGG